MARRPELTLPLITCASYVIFIPLTIYSALHPALIILMCAAGLAVAGCEVLMMVDRHVAPSTGTRKTIASPWYVLVQEILQITRVLSTTIVPILLATFGGASFVVVMQMQNFADQCSVTDLAMLSKADFMGFGCTDGVVAVSLQLGMPAWGDQPMEERRRLSEAVTVGESEGDRWGFIAPIFQSDEAFLNNAPPVAWAVKAGTPIRRSICDDDSALPGTCGFFAAPLKESWRKFPAPAKFGEGWGFNITHFSREEMADAIAEVRRRNPHRNLGDEMEEPVFVVAESIRQYFGLAYSCLWVLATLLCIGLIDRLTSAFEHIVQDEDKQPTEYGMVVRPWEGHEERGLLE